MGWASQLVDPASTAPHHDRHRRGQLETRNEIGGLQISQSATTLPLVESGAPSSPPAGSPRSTGPHLTHVWLWAWQEETARKR